LDVFVSSGLFLIFFGIYIFLIEIMVLNVNDGANDNRALKEEHVTLTMTMKYSF
jgi:hypothetical protein